MTLRIPRGFAIDRPAWKELCEGVRPNTQMVPLQAFTGLPVVRIDQVNYDPVVIEPGTLLGIYTDANGKDWAVPAYAGTGALYLQPDTTTSADFGMSTVTGLVQGTTGTYYYINNATGGTAVVSLAGALIKPIGACQQPIYSFQLNSAFTNYKRNDTVPMLCDYVVQFPAITANEHAIRAGDTVMLSDGDQMGAYTTIGSASTVFTNSSIAGRYMKFDATKLFANERVVGRCLKSWKFASTSDGTPTGKLVKDCTTVTLDAVGSLEFDGLSRVQTVPGLNLSGSGTSGIPGHLFGARADASGNFRALTILIRI